METAAHPLGVMVPVTGVGASAGGLVALQQFFEHVPPKSGMAYVVVVHLSPERESQIASLLQKRTSMPVVQVEGATHLEPDHVYVIPPDSNLSSVDGSVELVPRGPSGQNRAPIDLFFRSLAETHGAESAAIVLSGTGSDGAQGLRRIKEAGGITLAQQPEEAEHQAMPLAAIRTGMVDCVLGAAAMGPELLRLRRSEPSGMDALEGTDATPAAERPLRGILGEVKRRTGHDFTGYRSATVHRRVRRRMQLAGVPDVGSYLRVLRADSDEVASLHRDLLITVTSFFRDPGGVRGAGEDGDPVAVRGPGRRRRSGARLGRRLRDR